MIHLGTLKEITHLREVWPHEAHDLLLGWQKIYPSLVKKLVLIFL